MKSCFLLSVLAIAGCSLDVHGRGGPDTSAPPPHLAHADGDEQTGSSSDDAEGSSSDGGAGELDTCPDDPHKLAPGRCGCGVSDSDEDGDGRADCLSENDGPDSGEGDPGEGSACPEGDPCLTDFCPDTIKTDPGVCGCDHADVDQDRDGAPDCIDACPQDALKTRAGQCGCGQVDLDTDGDGAPDCHDGCEDDPAKQAPGICGCGEPDDDQDADGIADCQDWCPARLDCDEPPQLRLVEPRSYSVREGRLGVEVKAWSSYGVIESVTLFIDGEQIRTEFQSPYQWGMSSDSNRGELSHLSVGPHRLRVVARDGAGATTTLLTDFEIVAD